MGTAVHSQKNRLSLRTGVLLVPLWLALAPASAHAIKCTKPDDLCTGDPCVIRQVEVASPCTLDFGDRTLVIGGTLSVPNGGTLSLHARDIDVRRAIVGRHATPFVGIGGTIALSATDDIIVRWRIDASGRTAPGRISLDAGGDVRLLGPLRAAANGPNPTAPGGGIFVTAAGRITASRHARLRAEGGASTAGGTIALVAGRGVQLDNRIGADGHDGGSVAITTTAGDVMASRQLSANGLLGTGGSVVTFSQTGSVLLLDNIDAQGITGGGTIFAVSGKVLAANGHLRARANLSMGSGGTVVASGGSLVRLLDTVYADGARGGSIQVVSTGGDLHTVAPLLADGAYGAGGSIALSAAQAMTVDSQCNADGRTRGGDIAVAGRAVTIDNRGALFARGATGGTVNVTGDDVVVTAGARLLVDGDQPSGRIELDATVGDLTLSGRFRARGIGGSIEGSAARGVYADGEFEAAGAGCIGLSAGTNVDTSDGMFDVPVTTSCP
ncbi:MAG TPA: hypothetical protein VL049_15485 [Candidatus Dormibacteraeota bacterium]|nr:hypothetical protein [Candidatus Dormibacteraeota bacterium]